MIYDKTDDAVKGIYIFIPWPESQELMDRPWFDEEAVLDVDRKVSGTSASYFVPLHRWHEYLDANVPKECMHCENYSTKENFCNYYNEKKPVDYYCEQYVPNSPL